MAVKKWFSTYLCYTPDGLFSLNLYKSTEQVRFLWYFNYKRGSCWALDKGTKVLASAGRPRPTHFHQVGMIYTIWGNVIFAPIERLFFVKRWHQISKKEMQMIVFSCISRIGNFHTDSKGLLYLVMLLSVEHLAHHARAWDYVVCC